MGRNGVVNVMIPGQGHCPNLVMTVTTHSSLCSLPQPSQHIKHSLHTMMLYEPILTNLNRLTHSTNKTYEHLTRIRDTVLSA